MVTSFVVLAILTAFVVLGATVGLWHSYRPLAVVLPVVTCGLLAVPFAYPDGSGETKSSQDVDAVDKIVAEVKEGRDEFIALKSDFEGTVREFKDHMAGTRQAANNAVSDAKTSVGKIDEILTGASSLLDNMNQSFARMKRSGEDAVTLAFRSADAAGSSASSAKQSEADARTSSNAAKHFAEKIAMAETRLSRVLETNQIACRAPIETQHDGTRIVYEMGADGWCSARTVRETSQRVQYNRAVPYTTEYAPSTVVEPAYWGSTEYQTYYGSTYYSTPPHYVTTPQYTMPATVYRSYYPGVYYGPFSY